MSRTARTTAARVRIIVSAAAVLAAAALSLPSVASATSAFADQTEKECTYCHVTPGGPLTPAGQAFHDAGDVLSPVTTTTGGPTTTDSISGGPSTSDGPTTTDGTSGGGSTEGDGNRILAMPDWLHDLFIWAHLIAMTTWLGAIIFVHLVQTPRVAGQGIPRRYLRLAWPSIATLGLSGTLLTLNLIPSIGSLNDSRWGLLLVSKIAVFLLLVTVAAFATLVVSPRLKRLAEGGVSGGVAHEAHRAAGRVTVGYQGRTYDVSSSRLWRHGHHARRHDAWRDQSMAMGGAPHGPEVFEAFPELSGGPSRTPRPVRAFVTMAYANLTLVLAVLFIVAIW